MTNKKLVSIIVPVYNESLNIQRCYRELRDTVKELSDRFSFEILFCDNCSTDDSWQQIQSLSKSDSLVRGIRYSKNFGYQRSIYQGYLESKGDCAIQFDCDLQDPPELLVKFLDKWQEGNKIVYGKREKRQESFIMQSARKIFYRLANFLSEEELPVDVGEFRLIDRVVINQLSSSYDHQPYLRGLIATYGFKTATIPYNRNARLAGETKFNLKELFKIAFDGIFSYSVVPLRLSTYFGLIVCVGSLLYLIGIILYKILINPAWPAGFATITLLIVLMIGLNALFLGIIGEYLGRIFKQIKKADIAIVEYRTEE
jgi:glycosyltransferase involved in cell wall biosynthesis